MLRSNPFSFTAQRKLRWFERVITLAASLLLISSLTYAQGVRGTISGQVMDPNGAAIPGASVRLIDVAKRQDVRKVITDNNGGYQLLELEPSVYEIEISATGFATKRLTEIGVEPNRNLRLNASLNVVGATEEIIVSASEEAIDRETPTLGTTVDRQRVEGLPLDGRNVLNLALLQPGIVESNLNTTATFGGGLGIRVNGQRGVENNVQFDGSNNNEVAVGGAVGIQPRPDAVQEFRLLTSNYSAEFGRNSGSVINFVTRSGSSNLHGNARFFWRPTVLSAARFFDKALPDATPLRGDDDFRRSFERKEFGGNLGGPVRIPGIYSGSERTFFFADYEGRRQLLGDTELVQGLPTAAERMGDFSQLGRTLIDPTTGLPFPNNQIPQSRISPIARFYLDFLPTPGATGQALVAANQITNFNIFTARVDHTLTDKQTLNYTFNYFDQEINDPFAFGGSDVPGFGALDLRGTQNHVVRHTHAFTPRFINSLLLGYARNNQPAVAPQNRTTPEEIGFTADFVANRDLAGPPFISLFDRELGLGNSIQGPQARVAENFQIQDAVSLAVGDHRFKFGFDGTHYKQDQTFLFINQGVITFSGLFGGNTTGDDFADLLIGNSPIALQFGANGLRDFRQNFAATFAQDTWRVNKSLTLSLGFRWEYFSPLRDKFDRVAYYRPGAVSQLLTSGNLRTLDGTPIVVPPGGRAPVGLVYPGDPDPVLGGVVPRGGVEKDYNNWSPRIGLAYSLGQSTVIRAGYGIFYGALTGDTALQQLSAPGFNGTNAFFFPGSGTLADPFAPDPFPDIDGDQGQITNPFTANQFNISAPLTQFARPIDPRIRTPYTQQWNLTLERSFFKDFLASVSYVGNRGVKLYAEEQINPSLGTFIPVPAGRTIPTPTAGNTNSRRLNNDVLLGLSQLVSAGNSWYHALQANLQKRFGNGLLFQTAYTYSKSISDVSSDSNRGDLDLLDRRFVRGLSDDDVPHRFVASWIYEFPFTRGLGGLAGKLFDGWGFGGIATFQSGTPITVTNPSDTTGTGGGVLSFADIGAPFTQLDPRENDSRAFNVDAFRAFGTAAQGFVLARDFRRGTSGRNQVRAHNGINEWNFVVTKKTPLGTERAKLELRFEFFNAFNHAQFTTLDANLVNLVTDPVTGLPDPTRSSFGKFTDTRESRVIQLGARISF